ncbi:PQQ-binding-like beta-propeller repeat protein [Cellulomonas sp. zg-ZUI222]|uniref:PQQ-binding-like beta-propeller repeat protein n=1 Tax=Cellulomonas wangleii TaxID=2816956 RepID=A0ABX8D9L2_9CELL|nr:MULTISPECIES: PQQ-binding-like beta-propeller repeat protein [Cellulomonas]MBO0898550.1 PQQ-binding-like beta-propeller repeat protein [Cellulomonas sp. zg-ZUI22]MBO0919414.1 PQQ-binding-like beta-propeller repeat protein [Cellulomonas wangleii]MBO0924448.1 PQQ-binding-like beta-propeller repeat protein [Cellulomonas wangleii]QVI62442.1 PQQ-binding-like beta-propeller repeat protein [Cellulomonas wangleii]
MGRPLVVELDDEPDAPAPRPVREPRGRRWWVALLLVVALVLVVAQVVADARERDQNAALALVPGVLVPLAVAPQPAWRLDADTYDVTVVGAQLLEERLLPDGSMLLTSRDGTTGSPGWTASLLAAPDPPLPPAAARYGLDCTDGPALPRRVVCLMHDATAVRTRDGDAAGSSTATSEPATRAEIAVVDTATGTVTDRYPAGSGDTVAAALAVVGGTVVLAAPQPDGTSVWSLDATTGEERWRVHADTGSGGGWLRWGAEVRVVPVGDDAVAVLGGGAELLDAADGATLGSAGVLSTVQGTTPDGRALVVEVEGRTRLVGRDLDVDLDGNPVPVTFDDASAPALTLTTGGGLRAWDVTSGESRWHATAAVSTREAVVLTGRVHVHDGNEVTTLDARTGVVLWDASATELLGEDLRVTGVATDGVRLVVTGIDRLGSRAVVVAVDPADGAPVWRTEVPDAAAVADIEGLLLLWTGDDVAVLR